jgi:hypothetical protein
VIGVTYLWLTILMDSPGRLAASLPARGRFNLETASGIVGHASKQNEGTRRGASGFVLSLPRSVGGWGCGLVQGFVLEFAEVSHALGESA